MNNNKNFMTKVPMASMNIIIGCLVFLLIVLLLGLLLIQVPDNVEGHFNVYSSNVPRVLKSKYDGELLLLKKNKCKINAKEDIAFIKTSSDYYQVVELEEIISNKNFDFIKNNISKKRFSKLGELASPFYELVHSLEILDYEAKNIVNQIDKNQNQLSLISCKNTYETQKENIILEKEQLQLSKQNFEEDSALFMKNAITRTELFNSKESYIIKKRQLKESEEKLLQLENKIKATYNDHDKIEAQQNKEIKIDYTSAEYHLQILRASVKEWRNKYVLTSPCSGIIEYLPYLDNGQIVKIGEEIVKVIPKGEKIKAIIYFPTTNSAGVHIGSIVKLYFDNYDVHSYGYMTAELSSMSKIVTTNSDGSTFYTGELNIDLNKQNNFDGNISIDEGMSGKANVIIREKNLITKILNWINVLTKK